MDEVVLDWVEVQQGCRGIVGTGHALRLLSAEGLVVFGFTGPTVLPASLCW